MSDGGCDQLLKSVSQAAVHRAYLALPFFNARLRVFRPTLRIEAMPLIDSSPLSIACRACAIWSSDKAGGLPICLPRRRAASMPALVRSAISEQLKFGQSTNDVKDQFASRGRRVDPVSEGVEANVLLSTSIHEID